MSVVLHPESVHSFLPLTLTNRASDMGEQCELFWTPPCACLFHRLVSRTIRPFVSLDSRVSWYVVHLHLCSGLSQPLEFPDDMSGQPLSGAEVCVL